MPRGEKSAGRMLFPGAAATLAGKLYVLADKQQEIRLVCLISIPR